MIYTSIVMLVEAYQQVTHFAPLFTWGKLRSKASWESGSQLSALGFEVSLNGRIPVKPGQGPEFSHQHH